MSERRSHWTDDLIEAVYAELPAKKYQVEPDSWEVHRIIAAVEDWVLSAPIFDLYFSRKPPDKAAIQRVRKLCDDFEHEENLNGGIGRYAVVRVDRVRSALNGPMHETIVGDRA